MKNYLWLVAAASMFLFPTCSNDEGVINNGNNTSNDLQGQEFVMKVASSGDGLTTRAGRSLYSSEAGQAIDTVKIAIFKLGDNDVVEECVYTEEITGWSTSADVENYGSTSGDHGRYTSFNLKSKIDNGGIKGLDPGNYMVYAVGYSFNGSLYAYDPTLAELDGWDGSAAFTSVKATSSDGEGEEIFAGSIQKIVVNEGRNFEDGYVLYLHRQVAGAFGYFMNIPAEGHNGTAATALRLVARDKNKEVNMTGFNNSFTTTNANISYVVNGETSVATTDAKFYDDTDGYVVYEITLNEWFTSGDENNDGILNKDDTWGIPAAMQGKFNAVKGSLFGGEFVIPFANKNAATFELQLIDVGGNILRYWTVNLAAAQSGVKDAAGGDITGESVSSYSIVRNHLYSIGVKKEAYPGPDPSTPGNPKEPLDDPANSENPTDLSKGEILTLHVNDNWEVIEELVVEPGM